VDSVQRPLPIGMASVHTHSHYCDGYDEIEDYVKAATDAGLTAFGASGHSPLPFPTEWSMDLDKFARYTRDVRRLAAAYQDRLPVLLGLELDYLPGAEDFYQQNLFSAGLDYIVSSVHFVGDPTTNLWAYDESAQAFDEQIRRNYGGNAIPVVEEYYQRLTRMVADVDRWGVPVVVGHLDRIVLWNRDDRYFPTNNIWYQSLVGEALAAIARSKCILEINTSGWEKAIGAPNPNLAILRHAAKVGVPVIVSSDAHQSVHVARHFRRALAALAEAGFTRLVVPGVGAWSEVPLPAPNGEGVVPCG
jgi:histidinol-phosphatase (PHP family)